MAFSDVNSFLASFDGGARPNRYMVDLITQPKTVGIGVPTNLKFLCRSTSIPASTLGSCVLNYMGREIKVPGDRTFDDWSVVIYNTKDWKLRTWFEKWSSQILENFHNLDKNEESNTYDESGWMSEAVVWQLDRHEHVVAKYKVAGLFPTSISDIPLAYDNNNTVEEFTVNFVVGYWTSYATDQATPIPGEIVDTRIK